MLISTYLHTYKTSQKIREKFNLRRMLKDKKNDPINGIKYAICTVDKNIIGAPKMRNNYYPINNFC